MSTFSAIVQQSMGLPTTDANAYHNLRSKGVKGPTVERLQDLQNDSEATYEIDQGFGLTGRVTLSSRLANEEARVSTTCYDIAIAGEREKEMLYTSISGLETIVSRMFLEMVESGQGTSEVQIDFIDTSNPDHATISSGIWNLDAENEEALVSELIFNIMKYSQSESRTTTTDSVLLSVTIAETVLHGEGGGILPIAPFVSEKVYNALRNTGTVLAPVTQEPTDCFFISIYMTCLYNKFVDDLTHVKSAAAKKRLRFQLNTALTSEQILMDTKKYFLETGINIEDYEAGSMEAVQGLSEILGCQIHIYSMENACSRIAMFPESFRAELQQIHLVRLPDMTVRKRNSLQGETSHHFVGTRSITSFLSGGRLSICLICGLCFSYNHLKSHKCQTVEESDRKCFSCARIACDADIFEQSPPVLKINMCPRQPNNPNAGEQGERNCTIRCKKCSVLTQNNLCRNLHMRLCANRTRCTLCTIFIYHVNNHQSKDICDRHTFCKNCRKTVEDDPDNKDKRHTCFIPPEMNAHSPAAHLLSFDLETYPKKGHHWANLATLVYNTEA